MNFEFFVAKRIHFSKDKGDRRATPPVVRIAMTGVAIGLAVMIISIAVVIGFKKEVRNKVIGFGAHIQVTNFDSNISYESIPISAGDSIIEVLKNTDGVKHIEIFATKPGIIKTNIDFQGVVMRGVGEDFDTTFLRKHLTEGQMINIDSAKRTNEVLISRYTANLLHLECGDSFIAYFVNEPNVRARKFKISGIYNTGLSDYDKLFVICDIKHVRSLNGWDDDMVSGIGLFINDYNALDEITEKLYFSLIDKKDRLGNTYYVRSVEELNPMIFNWLNILDSNVVIILVLMIIVSGFTMTSGLLIIILEHTNMIGVLKALGENNYSIRKIFLYVSFFLIAKGMFWGNIAGLSVCLLQYYFRWFSLNPDTYYLDSVPVDLNWASFLLVNIGSLFASMFMMLAPSYLIMRIAPVKSIKFE